MRAGASQDAALRFWRVCLETVQKKQVGTALAFVALRRYLDRVALL